MDDIEHAFGTAIFIMDHTVQKMSADAALGTFGDLTQENFWRMWPQIKLWCDTLWNDIEDERGTHAQPHDEESFDELGGSG